MWMCENSKCMSTNIIMSTSKDLVKSIYYCSNCGLKMDKPIILENKYKPGDFPYMGP